MIRSFFYNIKQGFLQIFRNLGMSFASTFAIVAMLLILGLFFVLTVNINLLTEVVKQDYDQVEIFLQKEVTRDQADEMISELLRHEGVTDAKYRTEDEALEILKERWGESGYLLDSLGENPLPASILIGVDTLENAGQVVEFAGTLDGVDDISYYKETVDKLTKITDFLQASALIIMAFLIIVSIIVVSNTIKITVEAREHEIKIMKYVGATNWFIRGPFLAEGVIIGIIAALISTGAIALIYARLIEAIGSQILAIIACPLISVAYLSQNMLIIFLTLGAAIGAWGSIISMRRYLKA